MSGRRSYSTADVIKMYGDRIGDDLGRHPGLGPATEDDVRSAAYQLEIDVDGPWTLSTATKLEQALEGIVRAKRPRYRIERIMTAPGTPWAIVHDPEGKLENGKEEWRRFRRLTAAEDKRVLDREQWRTKRAGGPVAEVARRLGVAKRTVQNRRRDLRAIGVDPDLQARRVADDE